MNTFGKVTLLIGNILLMSSVLMPSLAAATMSMEKELAIQFAHKGKLEKATEQFLAYRKTVEHDIYETVSTDLWLGLVAGAAKSSPADTARYLQSGLCLGLPVAYRSQLAFTCAASTEAKEASETQETTETQEGIPLTTLNAEMLAASLAMLATEGLRTGNDTPAYTHLLLANRILLDPDSRRDHQQVMATVESPVGRAASNAETLNTLMLELEEEEKANQSQMMAVMFARKKGEEPDPSAVAGFQQSMMKKQYLEALKNSVCNPKPGQASEMIVNMFAKQLAGQEAFMSRARQAADNTRSANDCSKLSGAGSSRSKMGLPRKLTDEQKEYARLAKRNICSIPVFTSPTFTWEDVGATIGKSFSSAMEASRGSELSAFNIASEAMINRLIDYFGSVDQLEQEISTKGDKSKLRTRIVGCNTAGHLTGKLRDGLVFTLSREEKPLDYYEKAIGFALELEARNSSRNMQSTGMMITYHQLLAERYFRAGDRQKAETHYNEILQLATTRTPHHRELSMSQWTGGLISYAGYLQATHQSTEKILSVIDALNAKHEVIFRQASERAQLSDEERQTAELNSAIDSADFGSALDKVDVDAMLAEQGIVLPADARSDMDNELAGMKDMLSQMLSKENLKKVADSDEFREMQKKMQTEGAALEYSSDVNGSQVELQRQIYNEHREFQLRMAQALIAAGKADDAKTWLDRGEQASSAEYTSKVATLEAYVRAQYFRAKGKSTQASAAYEQAIRAWYFNPVSAMDSLTRVFATNTALLEEAANHEITTGDSAKAFVYIELARQANLGNPRIYGHLNEAQLAQYRTEIDKAYDNLLKLAARRAADKKESDQYQVALEQSRMQKEKSVRGKLGAVFPLYTGLDPMLPWLERTDLQGLLKDMENYTVLESNISLTGFRSDLLEQSRQNAQQTQLAMLEAQEAALDEEELFRSSGGASSSLSDSLLSLSSVDGGGWLNLKRVSELPAQLEADTSIVSLWMTRESLFVFRLDDEGVDGKLLPLAGTPMSPETFNDAFSETATAAIYQQVMAPMLGELRAKVVIMANGPLQNIPFAALHATGSSKFLGDSHQLRYAPGIEYAIRKPVSPNTVDHHLLVLAPTRVGIQTALGAAKNEAGMLKNRYRADVFMDEQVTRKVLDARLPDYTVVHYAGHAMLDNAMPDFSHLVLSDGNSGSDAYYVGDIKKLKLDHLQLAVLGACESARSNSFSLNNEFSALNGAFLEAGAQSVVASLRIVKDEIAQVFMEQMYANLERGKSRVRAVQLAQQFIRENHSQDPRDWAAFVLSGQDGGVQLH